MLEDLNRTDPFSLTLHQSNLFNAFLSTLTTCRCTRMHLFTYLGLVCPPETISFMWGEITPVYIFYHMPTT